MIITKDGANMVSSLSGEDVRKEVEAKILEENFGDTNEDLVESEAYRTK